MQKRSRRCFIGFIAVALVYIILSGIVVHLSGNEQPSDVWENTEWIASGKYWLDRQACRWLGLCGTLHMLDRSSWTWPHEEIDFVESTSGTDYWESGPDDEKSWSKEERNLREIPQYVLDHAPYVHLFSGEEYWPCDLADHLRHAVPSVNYTKILDLDHEANITNLDELNAYEGAQHGRFMYLTSKDNVEERPDWLAGEKNIPRIPQRLLDDFEEDEDDVPWPSLDDLADFDLDSTKQRVLTDSGRVNSPDDILSQGFFTERTVSPDGRCGGSSGYTCAGSKFGSCCSIYGWCGKSDDFCGPACDPLSGTCTLDPFHPVGPRPDLRRDLSGPQHKPQPGGRSSAPAFLIVVPKENGIVDAFWFFFYSYNLGQKVFNIRFGNHVGDWEHTAVRFRNGKPQQVFLSEHDFGDAYTWKAVEKYLPTHDGSGTMIGSWSNATAARVAKRPVIYSALGSHAMYGTPGLHPYILPWGVLRDETDRGPLWDPAQNLQAYTYDAKHGKLRASVLNPKSPTGWFYFTGHWGDKFYPLSDPRQYRFAGQYHYVNGPLGPRFKNLGRKEVCQRRGECVVHNWLGNPSVPFLFPPEENVEEGGLPGGNVTDAALEE